jgi:HEXXH motif-containing protein
MNAMTCSHGDAKTLRDFQMAVWISLNSDYPVGSVVLDAQAWAWSPDGGARIEPGAYDLALLAESLTGNRLDIPIALDPWAHSTKVAFHQLWRDEEPLSEEMRSTLQSDLRVCLGAILKMKEVLPACLDWVCSRTKVIVPLRSLSGEHSSSSSVSELPGVVFLTLHHQVQALEALVHESAHQHLFMAENSGPLVSPDHDALYSSPLRSDPRPLRGILLAAHALAYMKAYYRDAITASLSSSSSFLQSQLDEINKKYEDSRQTIVNNYKHFTNLGREFVDLTQKVACYGD